MKPGFTPSNLSYFADDAEIDPILVAMEFNQETPIYPGQSKRMSVSARFRTV